jgi:hypothetical protein
MTLGERILELHREGKSDREIGELVGKSKDQVFRIRKKVADGVPVSEVSPPRLDVDPDNPETATLTGGDSIKSLDELLERSKVNLSEWTVERHVCNAWTLADGSQAYQVKAFLKRIAGVATLMEAWHDWLADVESKGPRYKLKGPKNTRQNLLEIAIQDLHIGKLAWKEDTGNTYDTKIAVAAGEYAINDLADQARGYPVERILFLLGNDFYHYDNLTGTTTAGTPQDRDSRFAKMFLAGQKLATSQIEQLAEIAPVDVMVVPGNHARIAEWNLGQVVDAWFRNDERVTVNNSPKPRKYYEYGQTLLGFAHGDEEPHGKLPLIMAQEAPEMWSRTRYREIHLGHLHTSRRTDAKPVDGVNGVRVRILQSLSGTDKWHKDKGYVGEVGCAEAFVWNYDRGLRANLFSNRLVEAA